MKYCNVGSWLFSTVAAVALATSASAETEATAPTLTVKEAAQLLAAAVEENTLLRKWTLATAGMYTFQAPANSGVQIKVDGQLIVDAAGERMQEVGQPITGIISLQVGDHAIEVTGVTADHPLLGQITVSPVGSAPQTIISQTTELDADEAQTIVASRAALDPNASPITDVKPATTTAVASATPFSIGGGSSKVQQVATASAAAKAPVATQSSSVLAPASNSGSQMQRGALSSSIGRLGSIGSVPNVPTPLGGGNGGSGGGGGSPTPPPPPPPPPPPAMDSVVISPLTPPANVTLTSAVELTARGNAQGEVANTGATLFGAVMDSGMYDIVNVVVSPSNRTTIADVGPMTGQFAVRLFEEDFAQGAEVTVTLTGASSSGNEVVAEPVSYTVTGVAPTDGATQALSRMTFGPTPALYARIRGIGFEAYVEEQLNPDAIDDRGFESIRARRLLKPTTRNGGEMLRSIMAYEIAHAAFSQKQLQEVMGQFWMNHFHAVTKDTDMFQQNIDDRDFYRENALGNFEDMLLYSARSPLMSQYLDNDQNRRGRINENYGREIMELSTVGVDAGYGPEDVIAVSRIFTGWAYRRTNPNADGVASEYEFEFFPDRHDEDDKVIPFLNMTIAGRSGEAGVQEGEELVSILAQHPLTRTRICGKIARLLVSDTPPSNLIQACAAAWESSGGEVVPMLRAILLDPTYRQTVAYQRTKGKTPVEYAISAMRAFGATPNGSTEEVERFYRGFNQVFENAGMDPVRFPLPTGLPEVASAWANSASMIAAYRKMTEITRDPNRYGLDLMGSINDAGLESADEVASYLLTVATADRFSEEEYDAVLEALKGPDGLFEPQREGNDETRALRRAMGMIVVTPSFQLQ